MKDFKPLCVSGYDFDCGEFGNGTCFSGVCFSVLEMKKQICQRKKVLQNQFNSIIDICVHVKVTAN